MGRPYPSYKSSGVDLLGLLPAHWAWARLKQVLSDHLCYGANEPAEWDEPTWPRYIRITDLNANGTLRDDTFKSLPPEKARGYLLRDGDILLARSGATVGKAFIFRPNLGAAAFAGYLIRARCNQSIVDPGFVIYFLQSQAYWEWIHSALIQATIQNVSAEKYGDLPVPLPTLDEQLAIVDFLDREAAWIDALIEKKRRLLALLEEKRLALITHAVTKGLDPNTPMKDSGLRWLGEIPAHWSVLPLTRVVRRFVDYRGSTPTKVDSGVPLITATQIKNGRIDHSLDPVCITEEEYEGRMTRGFPEQGDVLVTTEAPLGETAQIENELVAPGQRIIMMKPDLTKVTADYLFAHFRSDVGRTELLSRASGSTASGIRADRLRASSVLVPPIAEQETITSYIAEGTKALPPLVNAIEQQITLLQEHRAALITNAVTGRIDVRATALTEEAA